MEYGKANKLQRMQTHVKRQNTEIYTGKEIECRPANMLLATETSTIRWPPKPHRRRRWLTATVTATQPREKENALAPKRKISRQRGAADSVLGNHGIAGDLILGQGPGSRRVKQMDIRPTGTGVRS